LFPHRRVVIHGFEIEGAPEEEICMTAESF
jgi:hypothetical protein